MVDARLNVRQGSSQQPSHAAIDNGNPAIFRPTFLVLDDANVDLLSVFTLGALGTAALTSYLSLITAAIAAVIVLVPLRMFFPRAVVPHGLALITGASSGIGAELTYILAERGHDLILVGRNEEQLDAVKSNVHTKYGKNATTVATDLSLPGAPKELYDWVRSQGHVVNVLVNNAGLGGAGDPFEQGIEFTERMTMLNCVALVQLTQLFGKDMIERGCGWMLQVSSVGGWMVSPGQNIYHASKHYVRAFSEALSIELRAYPGVHNTQLMPGPVHTQFITRGHAEEVFMMAASGAVEDPKTVAMAGYKGMCEARRMVYSSYNAGMTAFVMQLAPRCVHVTMGSLMNSPLRGWARAKEPEKDQAARGAKL